MKFSLFNYLSEHRYLLPVSIGVLTLITLLLTLLPGNALPSSQFWSYDKLGHFLLFGFWTYLIGLYRYFSTDKTDKLFTIFLLGVSFGVAIELLQYVLPVGRQADLFDIAFDSLGCLTAVLALRKSFSTIKSPREFLEKNTH